MVLDCGGKTYGEITLEAKDQIDCFRFVNTIVAKFLYLQF